MWECLSTQIKHNSSPDNSHGRKPVILVGVASDLPKELSTVHMKVFIPENGLMNAVKDGNISHNVDLLYQKYHTTHSPHMGKLADQEPTLFSSTKSLLGTSLGPEQNVVLFSIFILESLRDSCV
jgi:hypothetical protein